MEHLVNFVPCISTVACRRRISAGNGAGRDIDDHIGREVSVEKARILFAEISPGSFSVDIETQARRFQ